MQIMSTVRYISALMFTEHRLRKRTPVWTYLEKSPWSYETLVTTANLKPRSLKLVFSECDREAISCWESFPSLNGCQGSPSCVVRPIRLTCCVTVSLAMSGATLDQRQCGPIVNLRLDEDIFTQISPSKMTHREKSRFSVYCNVEMFEFMSRKILRTRNWSFGSEICTSVD